MSDLPLLVLAKRGLSGGLGQDRMTGMRLLPSIEVRDGRPMFRFPEKSPRTCTLKHPIVAR